MEASHQTSLLIIKMISLQYLIALTLWITINPKEPDKDDFKGTYVCITEALPIQFEKRIAINCDSSITAVFKGGRVYESMTGRWYYRNGILIVKLNPKIDKNGIETFPHWQKELEFTFFKHRIITHMAPSEKYSSHKRKYVFSKVNAQKCS